MRRASFALALTLAACFGMMPDDDPGSTRDVQSTDTRSGCSSADAWKSCFDKAQAVCRERHFTDEQCRGYVKEHCGTACPTPAPPTTDCRPADAWKMCADAAQPVCRERHYTDDQCRGYVKEHCGTACTTPAPPPMCRSAEEWKTCAVKVQPVCAERHLTDAQ